ncbi:MAG: universal stress protein [Burkholderiales bacterium]
MYQRLLIAVDSGALSRSAVSEGLALAKVHGAEVLFFHVVPNYVVPLSDMPLVGVPSVEELGRESQRNGGRVLASAAAMAQAQGVHSRGELGSAVDAAECIAQAATEHRCDLIVIGSHGRTAVQRLIHGSVVTRLLTLTKLPLLVCKKSADRSAHLDVVAPVPERQRASGATLAA